MKDRIPRGPFLNEKLFEKIKAKVRRVNPLGSAQPFALRSILVFKSQLALNTYQSYNGNSPIQNSIIETLV